MSDHWKITVEPKTVRHPGSPEQRVNIYRNGKLVARVYPINEEPGIQIYSEYLDFEQALRGLPDGANGQIVQHVAIEPTGPEAHVKVHGRWLGLALIDR